VFSNISPHHDEATNKQTKISFQAFVSSFYSTSVLYKHNFLLIDRDWVMNELWMIRFSGAYLSSPQKENFFLLAKRFECIKETISIMLMRKKMRDDDKMRQ
jgi:hypothetical protein